MKALLQTIGIALAAMFTFQSASAQDLDEAAARLLQRARLVHEQAHQDLDDGHGDSHLVAIAHQLVDAAEELHREIHHGHDFGAAWERMRRAHRHLMNEGHELHHTRAFDNDLHRYEDAYDRFVHELEHWMDHHHHHHHG